MALPNRLRPYLPPVLLAAAFGLLAWAVLARQGNPYAVDTGPLRWSVEHRPHGMATAARIVTHAGAGPFPYLAAGLGGWLGGCAGRRPAARLGAATALLALAALVVAQIGRTLLMLALDRRRPPVADWAVHASGHAFPSGHTSSSAMAAGLLCWGLLRFRPGAAGRWAAAATALVAVAVGLSRVYLGVHWLTDVLGGWLYAGCCLSLALPALTSYVRRRDQTDTP